MANLAKCSKVQKKYALNETRVCYMLQMKQSCCCLFEKNIFFYFLFVVIEVIAYIGF